MPVSSVSPARRSPRAPKARGLGVRVAAAAGLIAAAVSVAALAGCGPEPRVASPDDQAQLADGAHLADSLAAARTWDDAGVVALGYVERVRLGLGSPLRLAEQAAADARLPGTLGRRTAWALLGATLRGQSYAVDSASLGSDPGSLPPGAVVDGGWHRALIDSAVRAAPTARTGEEAVRIAYALARAEGLVAPRVAKAAVHAAALSRDRRLAAADVRRLLAASRAERTAPGHDVLAMLSDWRVGRRFLSEAPLLADALAPNAPEAVRQAEGLLERMRAEGLTVVVRPPVDTLTRPAADTLAGTADTTRGGVGSQTRVAAVSEGTSRAVPLMVPLAGPAIDPPGPTPVIGATPAARRDDPTLGAIPAPAARRLAGLLSVRAAYPSPPIVVTLGGFRHTLVADTLPVTDSSALFGRVRAQLALRARTEELLAAEWALVRDELPPGGVARRELAALVQAAAVAVRPWAQAPAVGVAAGTPTNRNGAAAEVDAVRARDGYRGIDFDATTPPAWQAAAARQLGDAVADLRAVFPDFSLDGLRVRVAESPRRDLALALHEPVTRTVYLPPATGAGTVAHELVHDLDWQAAHGPPGAGPLAAGGGYGTDYLARTGSGDLAQAVRGLGGAHGSRRSLGTAAPGTSPADVDRPAERLARGADFFVAAALAHEGRANGVLSAVQDPVLTGYAGVVAPEPGDGTAESLVEVLGTITTVSPATRAWYLARFGAAGVRSPLAVAQFALAALPSWDGERVLRVAGVPAGLAAPDRPGIAVGCGGVGGGAAAGWQLRLVWLAADARARGLVRARASRAVVSGGTYWGWPTRAILGGPWNPEPADASIARTRDAILRTALGEARRVGGLCAAAPLVTR